MQSNPSYHPHLHRSLPAVFVAALVIAFAPLAQATQVIANWDIVPWQRIAEPFKAGVVAFHETGVDVAIAVNGGDPALIEDPTWNDRTGVYEYWIEIDPADYPDGPLTMTATATPEGDGHEARTLEPLTLFANTGGSLGPGDPVWVDADNGSDANGDGTEDNPYRTIKKGVQSANPGGLVYLKASQNYVLESFGTITSEYWTTISGAPGLHPDDVQVGTYVEGGTGRYGRANIRWHNLSLYCERSSTGYGNIFYFDADRTWLDRVIVYDKNGRLANTTPFNKGRPYITNSRLHNLMNAGGRFQRNVLIEDIGSDIYRAGSNLTAINVTIRRMDKGNTGAHPDFFQLYNPGSISENLIFYNIRCYDMLAQGIFGGDGTLRDVAFVNLLLEKDPPSSNLRSQLSGDWQHILIWHTTIVDQTFHYRGIDGLRDFDVRNSVFNTYHAGATTDLPEINSLNIHTVSKTWNQPEYLGTNPTSGDPMYLDNSTDDYRLQPESPAYMTGEPVPGVPADVLGNRYHKETPNRGAFAAASNQNPAKKKMTHIPQ